MSGVFNDKDPTDIRKIVLEDVYHVITGNVYGDEQPRYVGCLVCPEKNQRRFRYDHWRSNMRRHLLMEHPHHYLEPMRDPSCSVEEFEKIVKSLIKRESRKYMAKNGQIGYRKTTVRNMNCAYCNEECHGLGAHIVQKHYDELYSQIIALQTNM